ncbi:MAG: hypothetical protein HXX12_04115 [Geothrix sp.]|uniref:hypothetical protein n=1 Tax=Geothrix sp. TaxID=1962974 RepID=UPI001800FEED|nr:hypothetical protein [Geothrix sp.]NWJ40139.1 hypothetical protein [Geothrix sp.]WIL21852.1 MAG: hypothetical protein QOZ81_001127 [Geothrix sp.]
MRHTLLALALVAGSSLAAQTTTINGGLQTGLSLPTGDFADKKFNGYYLGANDGLGIHFGGHMDFNFTPHHQMRLILNVNGFASKEQTIYGDKNQNSFGITQFGVDYVFNATSPNRGGYFLVGLNINKVKAKYELTGVPDFEANQSGKLGFRIGGGYNFNRVFSLEGHANSVSVDKNGADGLGMDSLTWVTVSAVFRFGR